jgi:hypothetical protein
MKCYKHNGIDASANCHDCGKALCNDCADQFSLMLCEGCLLANNEVVRKGLIRQFIKTVLFFAVGLFLGAQVEGGGLLGPIIIGYFFLSFPAGMTLARKLLGKAFDSDAGWVIAFSLGTAIFVGPFVAPFMIYKDIKELKSINALKRDIYAENGMNQVG